MNLHRASVLFGFLTGSILTSTSVVVAVIFLSPLVTPDPAPAPILQPLKVIT